MEWLEHPSVPIDFVGSVCGVPALADRCVFQDAVHEPQVHESALLAWHCELFVVQGHQVATLRSCS